MCFFDCLHDMGDPVGALKHTRSTLADDGTCMLVEPYANDRLEDNFNPVGRVYYAASTMVCTPASLDQEVGLALGAQAGEARLRDVARQACFTRFRRVAVRSIGYSKPARRVVSLCIADRRGFFRSPVVALLSGGDWFAFRK